MRKPIFAACAASAILSVSASSWANGRYPAANQLVFGPSDPNFMVLRTTFAVLPSDDNGANFRYICEGVLGLPSDQGEDPAVGVTANDSILAGVPGYVGGGLGLSVSADKGCNWNCIGGGLQGQSVVDDAVRPDTPGSAVAITGTYVPTDSAIDATYAQVFETTDNGQTWSPLGTPIDPAVVVTTIDVAKTDPNRIYVSGTRGLGASRTASLFVSRDKGTTWSESPIPGFDALTEQSIFIAAVDPTNADRVYLRSNGQQSGGQSRIYYTTNGGADAGASFSFTSSLPDEGGFEVEETGSNDLYGELLGFAVSPDGTKVYAGTVESGLWEANSSDMVFTQKNANLPIKCLATRNDELWACSQISANPSSFTLGMSTDDGATFTTKIHYVTSLCGPVECQANPGGPLGCGATTNATACVDAFNTYCSLTDVTNSCGVCNSTDGGGALGDAGSGASDAGGSGKSTPSSSSSCDVSVVRGRGGATGLAAGLLLAALALLRRGAQRRA